jgi:hypothetical protein
MPCDPISRHISKLAAVPPGSVDATPPDAVGSADRHSTIDGHNDLDNRTRALGNGPRRAGRDLSSVQDGRVLRCVGRVTGDPLRSENSSYRGVLQQCAGVGLLPARSMAIGRKAVIDDPAQRAPHVAALIVREEIVRQHDVTSLGQYGPSGPELGRVRQQACVSAHGGLAHQSIDTVLLEQALVHAMRARPNPQVAASRLGLVIKEDARRAT